MLEGIENIIFDLGGVILNLRYENSIERLSALTGKNVAEVYGQHQQIELFDLYETGNISSAAFRDGLRDLLKSPHLTDEAIDEAWNAMLLDLPPQRIHLIQELRKSRRVFLLSNTNAIHKEAFYQIFEETMGTDIGGFDSVFEKVYLSHEMGDRKPHPSIFQTVMEEQGLFPEKTLFIDDTEQHILGAQRTGLRTHHLQKGQTIEELFKGS
ncbi:HAD family phosphatase [Algivirga pacifica]|uniref:HAD family phosphatase n=1 Tax=Algivirga pacifica TaxID=1162670 RepID=A0ABP9CYD3_9BACT